MFKAAIRTLTSFPKNRSNILTKTSYNILPRTPSNIFPKIPGSFPNVVAETGRHSPPLGKWFLDHKNAGFYGAGTVLLGSALAYSLYSKHSISYAEDNTDGIIDKIKFKSLPTFTLEEVSSHNKPGDMYVIVSLPGLPVDVVVNISDWEEFHPNSRITEAAGGPVHNFWHYFQNHLEKPGCHDYFPREDKLEIILERVVGKMDKQYDFSTANQNPFLGEPKREDNPSVRVFSNQPYVAEIKQLNPKFITPLEAFFTRNNGPAVPYSPEQSIQFFLNGKSMEIKIEDIQNTLKLEYKSTVAILQCAGHRRAETKGSGVKWNNAVGNAIFSGYSLIEIIQKLGIAKEDFDNYIMIIESSDKPGGKNFTVGVPVSAISEEDLLARDINGVPLDRDHGGASRIIQVGKAGIFWAKSPQKISLIRTEELPFDPKYIEMGLSEKDARILTNAPNLLPYIEYSYEGDIKRAKFRLHYPVQSLLHPSLTRVKDNQVTVAGKAWSGNGEIAKVEISIDEGKTWNQAKLKDKPEHIKDLSTRYSWIAWEAQFAVPKDTPNVTIMYRATDSKGECQPEKSIENSRGLYFNQVGKYHLDFN